MENKYIVEEDFSTDEIKQFASSFRNGKKSAMDDNPISVGPILTNVTTVSFIVMAVLLALTAIGLAGGTVATKGNWKTTNYVAIMVVAVAAVNFSFMSYYWKRKRTSPTKYRYIDWIITVPLQIMEFYMIIYYSNVKIESRYFYQLFAASILMIVFGWFGEAGIIPFWWGFSIAMLFWLYIVFELYFGGIGKAINKLDENTLYPVKWLRRIIFYGWSIYPIGYLIGYYHDSGVWKDILYNFGDLINKILFVFIINYISISNSQKKN